MAEAIDKAFETTAKLLFGTGLGPMERYADWLQSRIPKGKTIKSAIGSGTCYLPAYGFFERIPKAKVVSWENLAQAETEKISVDGKETLGTLKEKLHGIRFVPNFVEGRNLDIKDTTLYLDCINVCKSFDVFTTRNSAYVFSTIDSESLFGCYRIGYSKFCVHCYNCTTLSGCFEMDSSKNCGSSMFCHDCEGLSNCMFCFNVKNKRYAIGNVEVGREQYEKAKQVVLKEITESLENDFSYGLDIYNLLGREEQ